jgi:predicted nucleic acid-binding protein
MIKIFLDTNIIIDLLAERQPFYKYAVEIFKKAHTGDVKLFTSSHSIATSHYLLKKHVEEKELRTILLDVLEFVSIISVDEEVMKNSLRSNYKDFEDAVQILCANSIENMDFIVTRNIKDFKNSPVLVLPPHLAFDKITKQPNQ